MKLATRRKIVQAVRKRMEEVFGEIAANEEEAREEISDIFHKADVFSKKKPDQKLLQRGLRAGLALGFWPDVGKGLKTRPEPTPEQLEKTLREIGDLDVHYIFRSVVKNVSRKLPPFPPGKLPTFRKPEERKEIISEVEGLATKHSRKEAYKRVAKKRGVHWRTIQNVCLGVRPKEEPNGEDDNETT